MKVKDTSLVSDILKVYPEAFDVFLVNGFKYDSIDSLVKAVGENTMLKTVLSVKGVNPDLFIFHLEEKILNSESEKTYILNEFNFSKKLDVYGNTICPLKFTLKDAMENIIKENIKETGEPLKVYMDAGKDGCDDESWIDKDIKDFPRAILSKEFNQYLSKGFIDKHLGQGNFKGDFYKNININKEILDAEICDPLGEYGVYAVMADVFLVDVDRLGDLPVPKTTSDLLNPIYKDNIVIFGKKKKEFSNASFLYINKEFGIDGLKKFAHNVKSALHGAQMSKAAGSKSGDGGAIYLVSWFFAKTCSKKNVKIIWPEDGAMTLPMYLLVKKDEEDKVKNIIDYITGEEFGEHCVRSNTPVVNGDVNNHLPEGAGFKWLGWDYIRENDISKVAEKNEEIFMRHWREYHPSQSIFK